MAFPASRARKPGSHIKKEAKTALGRRKNIPLHLTSMIDMFTILVVFLLKSFSTEGEIMTISPDLVLPESIQTKKPERSLILAVNNEVITVEGKKVISVEEVLEMEDILIRPLQRELTKRAELTKAIAAKNPAVQFTGDIIIQGDKKIPFKLLEKVMYTCGQSEYTNMNLAVYTKEARGEMKVRY